MNHKKPAYNRFMFEKTGVENEQVTGVLYKGYKMHIVIPTN